jgi:hypothetical protein
MFGTRLNYDCDFFVSGQRLSGIQNLDIAYSNSAVVTKPLGYVEGTTTIAGPTQQSVSLNRYFIYDDPIYNYTGDTNMSGSIEYGGISYGFQSGYLTSYSVNAAVGTVPQVNANIVVYDEMRSGYSASGNVAHPTIDVPTQGSMSITSDWTNSNRVIGMDYSVSSNRKPYYSVGSEAPIGVAFLPPLEITASVQYDVDEAFMASGYSFLGDGKENKTAILQINGRDGTNLATLSVPNASLVGETLTASSQGNLILTQEYVGHTA